MKEVNWMMRKPFGLVVLILLLAPMLASSVAAQDASHITIGASRADGLDMNIDGDDDRINVTALIGSSLNAVSIGVEVTASTADITLTFWDNFTLNAGDVHTVRTVIDAWEDAEYTIEMRVLDLDSGMLVNSSEFGPFELMASLTQPSLSMSLESTESLFTGETCLINRSFSDQVGARYDRTGIISISGSPWLVGEHESPVDCSRWPAGEYVVTEHYRNGLGMVATEELRFTIHIHPPPAFEIVVSGGDTPAGTPCELVSNATEGTRLAEMDIDWYVTQPNQEIDWHGDTSILDCTMWAPGVHKVRVSMTSAQGRETTEALNLIRLPPPADASEIVLNASGDPDRWPTVSQGDAYKPEPLFVSLSISAAIVGAITFVFAVLAGVVVARLTSRSRRDTSEDWEESFIPDAEGLPTFTDDEGLHWRQQTDGSVDWWDASNQVWTRYEA